MSKGTFFRGRRIFPNLWHSQLAFTIIEYWKEMGFLDCFIVEAEVFHRFSLHEVVVLVHLTCWTYACFTVIEVFAGCNSNCTVRSRQIGWVYVHLFHRFLRQTHRHSRHPCLVAHVTHALHVHHLLYFRSGACALSLHWACVTPTL